MFPDGPPKSMDDWLHETYLNLTTGVRLKGESSDRMSAFKGPANLAKKLSQERVIHFKSADDWFDYNTQFGFGNLREAYVQGIHRSAESTGLMQVLGTNRIQSITWMQSFSPFGQTCRVVIRRRCRHSIGRFAAERGLKML
jgi:hypothetical protein